MKRLLFSTVLLTIFTTSSAVFGQQPTRSEKQTVDNLAGIPSTSMTPEMWLYLHDQRRSDDPAQAVRRMAEQKAVYREQRLASSRWYGVSNSRPTVAMVPIMGSYSPSWVGNGWNSYHWIASGYRPTSYIRIEHAESRR